MLAWFRRGMRLDRGMSTEPPVVNQRTVFIEALDIADPAERRHRPAASPPTSRRYAS
jgi:hypothetical protein